MTTILDPGDERQPIRRRPAQRPRELRGLVGLLDISKARGDVFLDRLQARIEALPGVRVKRYRKPTFARPAPPDLRREIAEECSFVVEALAD